MRIIERMKRKKLSKVVALSLTIASVFTLCSCAGKLEYTEQQEDVIADYMANLLLRHDVNYQYEYISEEETTTEEVTDEQEETTDLYAEEINGSQDVNSTPEMGGDNKVSTDDLASALEMPEGISVKYDGYEVTDIFSDDEDSLFVMKAVEGYRLLVVKFKVTNTTGEDISVNMMEKISKYKGIVNDNKKYNSQLTLFLNALNTFEGTISAGSTKTMFLLYQTQLDSAEQLSSLSVELTDKSDNKTIIELK